MKQCLILLVTLILILGTATHVIAAKELPDAPALSLKDITDMEGDPVTLESFKGEVVLLNIFTTT